MDPYRFLAILGTQSLLENGGNKILPVIPQLIIPIKSIFLNNYYIILSQSQYQRYGYSGGSIEDITKTSGQWRNDWGGTWYFQINKILLVPYYRQLLPIMNLYKNYNANIGDNIDYKQRKR